jgi:hypothetical protein
LEKPENSANADSTGELKVEKPESDVSLMTSELEVKALELLVYCFDAATHQEYETNLK